MARNTLPLYRLRYFELERKSFKLPIKTVILTGSGAPFPGSAEGEDTKKFKLRLK
jgi:hypothetical protein